MTTSVQTNLLRDLAAFRARTGCALSVHVDLDPSVTPTTPDVDARFRAVLSEAEKLGEARAGGRDCRLAVRANVERIRRWWDGEFERDGARGLAIFASAADEFFRVVTLPWPVRDAVSVDEELLVTPLVDRFGHSTTLVAVVSRERGLVYRLRGNRLEEIVDETEEQPGRHDQGGWAQARYQRHIEHLVHQHLKTVGGELARRTRGGGPQLVVVCPEEMRGTFAATLSQEARDAVVGWASAEAHASEAELLCVVEPLLAAAAARHRRDWLARFANERGRSGRAAAGWQETLDAAADTRVALLLLTDRAYRVVFQCPECRRAFVEDGTCPIDGLALQRRDDGAGVAARQTLVNGGEVMRFGAGALGDEEIGAVLRF